jgi:hypothetical protein
MSKHKYRLCLLLFACSIGTMSGQMVRYTFDVVYETYKGAWVPNIAREEAVKSETNTLDLLMYDTNGESRNLVKATGAGGKGYALDLSCNLPGVESAAKAMRVLATSNKELSRLTLTGWIRNSAPMKSETILFGGHHGGNQDAPHNGFWLTANDASSLHVRLIERGVAVRSGISDERISRQGEWIFYAVSWNGETGIFQWYLGDESTKAALIASQKIPKSVGMKIIFRHLSIGGTTANHTAYCGVLDDIRIYAEALTPEQAEKVRESQFQ